MSRSNKPKKRGARVTLYKDAAEELTHIEDCDQRAKDEVSFDDRMDNARWF